MGLSANTAICDWVQNTGIKWDVCATLPVSGGLKRGMNLKFSPKDIYAVFKALTSTQADLFEVQPDDMGGMAISWMDELAQYRLFVPTCRAKDLSRTDRLLAPMAAAIVAAADVGDEQGADDALPMDAIAQVLQSTDTDDPCAL